MNDDTNKPTDTLGSIADEATAPTPSTTPTAYDKLKSIRARKDLEARPSPFLKTTFTALDGTERPLKLRYYQVQGVMHLLAMPRFLLGDDTGLGKCKPRNSLVLTGQGLLELGSLGPQGDLTPDTFYPVGDSVKVWSGWAWAPVKRFYYGGSKPIKRVKTTRGYETQGTFVHPLLVRRGGVDSFVEMKDCRVGDYLAISRSSVDFPTEEPVLNLPDLSTMGNAAKVFPVRTRLTPGLASLLGYIVAEGHTNSRYNVSITQFRTCNPEVHDHIRELCASELGWVDNQANENDTVIPITGVYIREYLRGLGIGNDLSATKTVPWPIFQATKESVACFLRAFFDGEGSSDGGVLEISSASEILLRDIQILLLRFGILGTRSPKLVKGRDHTYWRLTICGDDARRFGATIGFLTPRKQEALEVDTTKSPNPNLDVIPHVRDLVESIRADIKSKVTVKGANAKRKGSGIAQFGVSFEKLLNNIRHDDQRNLTYASLGKILDIAVRVGADTSDAYQMMTRIQEASFFYDPIVSVEDAGSEEVVDIEVDDPTHSFVADGFVNHNTIESIASLCYLWERNNDQKVIVLTSKSAVEQWAGEFEKFTVGVTTFVCRGTPGQRKKARDKFMACKGPSVLVMGYSSAKQDFREIIDWSDYILITDEATAYKNPDTQTHKVCKYLSSKACRTWALTATLIKNDLLEGWGIYGVVVPGLFGSMNAFMNEYCITRLMTIPGSRRQIPMIVGYKPRDIVAFREKIDPYFLGRPKFEVASELPPLITKHIKVDLTDEQESKYSEALSGLLQVGTGAASKESEEKEVTKLTAVTYCQQIVNHLELIGCDGDSSKLDALVDFLSEGEFAGEKVIVFTRFRKMVDIIVPALKKAKIKAVRITGAEDEKERRAAQDVFQDPKSDVKVVCITTAAAEAINLQAAKALVFYDSPWSAGDYLQILGRMIRIGSTHDRCYAVHLVARGTIDDRVAQVLQKKMGLVEAVLGKRIKGEDSDVTVDTSNDLSDLFNFLVDDARSRK